MTDDGEELLSISGIQHFAFCRRQWALIHIEQQWDENVLTVGGELMHRNAHDNHSIEKRGDIIISRGMPVKSSELGMTGVCDVVEFHRSDDGAIIYGYDGLYKIIPVEYKYGEPKENDCDILQTAAQAMCLEEMYCTVVDEIQIFYGRNRHRLKLSLDDALRERVRSLSREMHDLYSRKHTPVVKPKRCCNACSLKEICLPKLSKTVSVERYIAAAIGAESE